jgi:hypothetical protein
MSTEQFEFEVVLKVCVEAFDKSDAKDILHDVFDTGEECGVEVLDVQIKE